VNANKEMSKPFHIRLLNVIYQAAADLSYFGLDYNDTTVSLIYGLQMKRTQEAIQERLAREKIITSFF
jgi:hypothetical protein